MTADHYFLQLAPDDQISDDLGKGLGAVIADRFPDLLIAEVDTVKDTHEFGAVGVDKLPDLRLYLPEQLIVCIVGAARKADLQPEHVKVLYDLGCRSLDKIEAVEILGDITGVHAFFAWQYYALLFARTFSRRKRSTTLLLTMCSSMISSTSRNSTPT